MKRIICIALLLLLAAPAMAVTNVIDPEIPVNNELLNNEQNYVELFITVIGIVAIAGAGMTSVIFVGLLIAAGFYGIRIL